jgi:hypothetical protein
MSKPVNKVTANPIGALVTDCATRCEAFAACGGNRGDYPWAIPCGCAWTQSSGKRHKCEECSIHCRERKKEGPNGPEPDFATRLDEGLLLDQITVYQNLNRAFPLFIPMNTFELSSEGSPYPFRWVAADVPRLFNTKSVRPKFETELSARDHLRVGPDCNLLAVLNGEDSFLENFWAMNRSLALKKLHESGFSIGTGATFSVNDLTKDGTPMPYSHNTTMLMRHHRSVYEIQMAGMEAIPNLYWIDGDQRELNHWAEWLMLNIGIHNVSRDFSSTRDTPTVMNKLNELISLLNKVGRSFHVLVIGTGCNTAPLVLRALAESGHSGSIVTAAPIHAARYNVIYHLDSNGHVVDERRTDKSMPFSVLRLHNMEVFEQALFKAVAGTSMENRALPNVLSTSI